MSRQKMREKSGRRYFRDKFKKLSLQKVEFVYGEGLQ